ncbi:phosphatase PAP2 family protein [Candidatus Dojkabacteria bacterium]|uniref:Phosphatase PAP2 family protein n=1 Tax=Candidatus Dojkabacteria bacterium TaxID=2099670 RepID=A0A955I5J9_9BACT|nr:phosphatase PAP2 family protein [Candidatus Dojkabacteria bacterium]
MGKVQFKVSALIISFLLIWLGLQFAPVADLDKQLTLGIYDLAHSETVNSIFGLVSDYAIGGLVMLMLIAILLHWRHSLQAAIIFLISSGGIALLVEAGKPAFDRARPFAALSDVALLSGGLTNGTSFPSSHAAVAMFTAFFIVKVLKLSAIQSGMIYALAVLVAFSRVYLGAHYVFDVFAGILIGLAVGWLIVDEWYDRGVEGLRM